MKLRGFTFIELIIVIAIILVISVGVITNYTSYTNKERVRQAALTIKSDLRLAASKVNSGVTGVKSDDCMTLESYDVSFIKSCPDDAQRSCYTITPNCAGGASGTGEETKVYLPKEVHFQSDETIQFLPLSAGTSKETTLILEGVSVAGYTITISLSGTITITEN